MVRSRRICLGLLVLAAASQPENAQVIRKTETQSVRNQIRELIARWNDAYRRLDAKVLASLETVDVEIVDRFGQLHRPSDVSGREQLWAEGFEMIAKGSAAPESTIEQIRLISPDTASVQVCTHFSDGIRLTDGARIPPLWEINSYLIVKKRSAWLVAALNIHDQTPPEGCTSSRRVR